MLASIFKYINLSPSTSQYIDWVMVTLVASVIGVGVVMISSASSEIAVSRYGSEFYFSLRQGIFSVISVFGALVILAIPMNLWKRMSLALAPLALALLVLVLVVGREINGSVRWIPLGFINLQASEVAKFCLIIYLAGYLVRHRDSALTTWLGFIKPLVVLLLALILLLLEPDFGAVVVLAAAFISVLFLAGLPLGRFFLVATGSIAALVLVAVSQPYRMQRLTTYMDPWEHQFSSGYQLTQALIAFGRGEWLGEGLGNSIQKLFYLPEAHTDFVYAVIAEELGLIGSLMVLLLLMAIIWRTFHIGRLAEQVGRFFSAYVAYGIGVLLGAQILINMGVNTGLLPTKGLALPFLSYGGSSLMMNCAAVGMLLRIDFERRRSAGSVLVKKGAGSK